MPLSKQEKRKRIHMRIRKKISGSASLPRLSVYRSNKYIYCQVIDDVAKRTIAAASSREASINFDGTTKIEQSKQVGTLIAERMKAENITTAVFDRGGYLYHGRVKAIADGAREAGIKM